MERIKKKYENNKNNIYIDKNYNNKNINKYNNKNI